MSANRNTLLCFISGCSNSVSGQDQSSVLYCVPKDPARAKKWTEIIKPYLVPGVPLLEALTCDKHFRPHDYVDNNPNSFKLKPTALPSIFEEGESLNPAKKLKLGIPTTPSQSTQVPLNAVVLNSPETRVFVLEASMFSNNAARPEPRKILPKAVCQAKKIDTIQPIAMEDSDILLVEAERLKDQISSAKAKKQMLSEEYNKVVEEEKTVLKEISEIELEMKGYNDKQKFSKEELELLRKCYSPSQIRHLHGNKKPNWSKDDLAMGFNITCMTSTNFYKYLRDEMQFPLPAVSNIARCSKELTDTLEKEGEIADAYENDSYCH